METSGRKKDELEVDLLIQILEMCDNFSISFRVLSQYFLKRFWSSFGSLRISCSWYNSVGVDADLAKKIFWRSDCNDGLESSPVGGISRSLAFELDPSTSSTASCLFNPIMRAVLQALVGRNVDGIDLNLYYQSLQLLRQFQAHHLKNPAT
ncbi:PREDICTED: CST complex subunit TEN1 [Prunus dulcis]|uniref:PREDICTED: CST complex subunit TEN1 n=1 Tax=Prunus dulcis TaxID=3755 RepID=A0A5E4ESF3_PRUDU|nr:PREDICTED: CST complex subunit TEN1 [Prunus dulcis]